MVKEQPQLIELHKHPDSEDFDPQKYRINIEENCSPEDLKNPNLIVLLKAPTDLRDQIFGNFASQWSRLERQFLFLLNQLLDGDLRVSGAILSLGLNVNQLSSLVKTLAFEKIQEQQFARLRRILSRYSKLNTKRNRLIHADWVCAYYLILEENGTIAVKEAQWIRKYSPHDFDTNEAIKNGDTKLRDSFRKTLADIDRDAKTVVNLTSDFEEFLDDIEKQP